MKKHIDIMVIPRTIETQELDLMAICGEARKEGIFIVSSAGDCFLSAKWPAGWPSEYAISVGSVRLGKQKTPYLQDNTEHVQNSNKWPYLDYVAPGKDVISTYLSGRYYIGNGTSIAAPHIAGVISLGLSLTRQIGVSLTTSQIEQILTDTCHKYDSPFHQIEALDLLNYTDPQRKLFKDEQEMLRAMYGHGLVQSKEFILEICRQVNSSTSRKVYIE